MTEISMKSLLDSPRSVCLRARVPVPEVLPPIVPPLGPTLPVIADAEEPRPEPSARDLPNIGIASSNPDSDPDIDKLKRELQEQKDLHESQMETYQRHAQAIQMRLDATVSRDRLQLQSIAAQCQFIENSRRTEFQAAVAELERTRIVQGEQYAEKFASLTEKMSDVSRIENNICALAVGQIF